MVLDFDGTVTMKDVGDSILKRFAGLTEAEIRASYDPRVVTEDWMREKFRLVRSPLREIQRFVLASVRLRPGFSRLVGWCRESGVPLEIVSGGVDLYLDLLLERWRVGSVPRFRAVSRPTARGILVRYPFLRDARLDAFKRGRVAVHQRRGRRVLFAGDGTSDIPAARAADAVFAAGSLWRYCRENAVPARKLETFEEVREHLIQASTKEKGKDRGHGGGLLMTRRSSALGGRRPPRA